jgi:hypothetical protein
MQNNSLSFWERNTWFESADVIIVGAGLVGLNAAIELKVRAPQLKILVLERGPLPSGASTKNAGFACFGSPSELLDDLEQVGPELTWETVAMRWKGLQRLRTLLGDEAIRYEGLGGFEVFTSEDQSRYETAMEQLADLNRLLAELTGVGEVFQRADDRIPGFGFQGVRHLLVNTAEGQIDTGQMVKALVRKALDLDILLINGVGVSGFEQNGDKGVHLQTDLGWQLQARKVLLCTNGFTRRLFPNLAVNPARNQVMVTQPIPGLRLKGCFHYDRGYFYLRNIGDRVLVGGGRHLAGEQEQTDAFGTTPFIQETLSHLLDTVFLPDTAWKADYWWSGILGIGPSKKPIISWADEHVAVAVRLGGMGVAIGSLVGAEGADLILEAL